MFEGLFQPTHLLVIVGLALLLFGPKKLLSWAKASAKVSAASSRQLTGMKATGAESHSAKQAE